MVNTQSGKRDFQDGATGRNKIVFRNILLGKRGQERKAKLKGFTLFPSDLTVSKTLPWGK